MPGAARDGEQGLCRGPFLCWNHLATITHHTDAGLTLLKAQLQYHYYTEVLPEPQPQCFPTGSQMLFTFPTMAWKYLEVCFLGA